MTMNISFSQGLGSGSVDPATGRKPVLRPGLRPSATWIAWWNLAFIWLAWKWHGYDVVRRFRGKDSKVLFL